MLSAVPPAAAQAGPTAPPAGSATVQTDNLSTLLRDALFEEEATRDLTKAAAGYEALLAKWSEHRQLAASALFRLAEVRRKQDRKDDAIKLYQRLLTDFADVEPQAKLSRENLVGLGAKDPAPGTAPALASEPAASDEEAQALARVQKLAIESPDLLVGEEFTGACRNGWLSVVKFLINRKFTDNGDGLRDAAESGHLAIVRELLSQKPPLSQLARALRNAVGSGRAAVAKLLLENGAPPDDPDKARPPLVAAIRYGYSEIVDLLLAAKASVDCPHANTSPLFAAARKGDAALLERLLKISTIPNDGGRALLLNTEAFPGINVDRNDPASDADGSTPLHAAVWSGKSECVSLLLKAKADPNVTNAHGWTPLHAAAKAADTVMIEQLLAAGANPNPPAPDVSVARTPLALAVLALQLEISTTTDAIAALLKAKANLSDPFNIEFSSISIAVGVRVAELRNSVLTMLLEHGAFLGDALSAAHPNVRIPLLRSYRYPKLAREPAIALSIGHANFQEPLARRVQSEEKPASLPSLLLAWHQKKENGKGIGSVPDWSIIRLWRKGEDGKLAETVLTLKPGMDFPTLQWGDVVEVLSSDWDSPMQPQPQSNPPGQRQTFDLQLPLGTQAILRASQSARITFKSGDVTKSITLRGVLRTYDLTTDEAPLLSTKTLVTLLAGDRLGVVKVERTAERGGGTVEWATGSGDGGALPEDGDIITFTPDAPNADTLRQDLHMNKWPGIFLRASLSVPGQLGVWQEWGADKEPTLLQFIGDFYLGLPISEILPKEEQGREQRAANLKALSPERLITNLINSGGPVSNRPYLPWPDWSGVKIRRVKVPSDSEISRNDFKLTWSEPETIDLLAAMNSLTPESTPEDARKFDLPLNPGDEVELPLLKDHPPGPWPGFDEAALRLFTKALSAKITVVDPDGGFRETTLQLLPPRWVPTAAGVLPVPNGDALGGRVHGLRAGDLADSVAPGLYVSHVIRDGKPRVHENITPRSQDYSKQLYLRHGDTLHLTKK